MERLPRFDVTLENFIQLCPVILTIHTRSNEFKVSGHLSAHLLISSRCTSAVLIKSPKQRCGWAYRAYPASELRLFARRWRGVVVADDAHETKI